jgi:hypothetical protein
MRSASTGFVIWGSGKRPDTGRISQGGQSAGWSRYWDSQRQVAKRSWADRSVHGGALWRGRSRMKESGA